MSLSRLVFRTGCGIWLYRFLISVTVVICWSIMNAHSSQKLSMKLCAIQTAHGFARNVNSSTFLIPSLVNRWTLETENRFVPLTKEKKDRSSLCGTNKSSSISGLKFISMNIISIRGKKLELLAFLDFHQPHVVATQETKIDSSIATSELFLETCPYSVYRKVRNIHGGGVMLLVHKDFSHMPITELENDSVSIWVKVFANKTSHFVASWYRPPGSTSEEFQLFFREQLDYIRTHHKGKKLPSVHVLGDFNFKDIDWPDRLSKSCSTLSQSEG